MDDDIETCTAQVEGIFSLIRGHSYKIMTNEPTHTTFKGRRIQGMPIINFCISRCHEGIVRLVFGVIF